MSAAEAAADAGAVARASARRMAAMADGEPTPADEVPPFTPMDWVRPRKWSWAGGGS